jgi:flagellar hook-associated protein 3 FlgL
MRVSDSMLYTQASNDINQDESQIQISSQQASSGLAVQHPWDAPAEAGLAVEFQFQQAQFTSIAQGTQLASQELSTADSSLTAVQNAVEQAVTLAQEMGSGPMTASEQSGAAQQVAALQNTVVASLNAQVGNRYIFGGTLDSAPPFSATGAYSGNGQVRQVEVAPGVYQAASVQADVAIKGTGGGVDVFAALSNLSTALQSNNSAAILAAEAPLQTALQQVIQARSEGGSNAAALQTANQVMQTAQLNATTNDSNVVDANEVTVATELQQAQTVYQAAISASSKSFQLLLSTTQQAGS